MFMLRFQNDLNQTNNLRCIFQSIFAIYYNLSISIFDLLKLKISGEKYERGSILRVGFNLSVKLRLLVCYEEALGIYIVAFGYNGPVFRCT